MENTKPPMLTNRRVRWLILLGLLTVAVVLRDFAASLPHEPRVYLVNESGGALDNEVIKSAFGDIKLPRLDDGQSIRLNLHPRADCNYAIRGETIEGAHLVRLLELGRKEKADVRLELGIDYLDADLSTQYRFW